MLIKSKRSRIVLAAAVALILSNCEKEIVKVKDDLTPPVITVEPFLEATHTTATIRWTTDEPCSVQVKYLIAETIDTLTKSDTEFRQGHVVVLENLSPNSTYQFLTLNFDVAGNLAETDLLSFTTAIDTAYYLSHGWELYAAGDYAGARNDFRQYLTYFPENLPGLTALGWSQLQNKTLIDSSIISFNAVLNINENYVDAIAGICVAFYRRYNLSALQGYAENLLSIDSLYVFANDERYTNVMVRLMLAEGYNATDRLDDTQWLVDIIYPENGLDPADSTTWKVVDGSDTYIYDSYSSALSGVIAYLKWIWWEQVGLPKPNFLFRG